MPVTEWGECVTGLLKHPASFLVSRVEMGGLRQELCVVISSVNFRSVAQPCLTLRLPGTVARQAPLSTGLSGESTGVVAMTSFRGSSQPEGGTRQACVSCVFRTSWCSLYLSTTWEMPRQKLTSLHWISAEDNANLPLNVWGAEKGKENSPRMYVSLEPPEQTGRKADWRTLASVLWDP